MLFLARIWFEVRVQSNSSKSLSSIHGILNTLQSHKKMRSLVFFFHWIFVPGLRKYNRRQTKTCSGSSLMPKVVGRAKRKRRSFWLYSCDREHCSDYAVNRFSCQLGWHVLVWVHDAWLQLIKMSAHAPIKATSLTPRSHWSGFGKLFIELIRTLCGMLWNEQDPNTDNELFLLYSRSPLRLYSSNNHISGECTWLDNHLQFWSPSVCLLPRTENCCLLCDLLIMPILGGMISCVERPAGR